jgi:hypothetical protein
MGYILNATKEKQTVKALGKWFVFNPEQVKQMSDDMTLFISQNKTEQGLVALPEQWEDMEWRSSPEGKEALSEAKKLGMEQYIANLRKLIYNNQVSLRADLEKSGIKADPAAFASEGELNAMRLVAQYQAQAEDEAQKRIQEVKELVKKTGTGK